MIATTTGNYPSANGWTVRPGEALTVAALGTFDGATVTFQAFIDAAWRAIPNAAFTASGAVVIDIPATQALRAALTDAGASTSISITLANVIKS